MNPAMPMTHEVIVEPSGWHESPRRRYGWLKTFFWTSLTVAILLGNPGGNLFWLAICGTSALQRLLWTLKTFRFEFRGPVLWVNDKLHHTIPLDFREVQNLDNRMGPNLRIEFTNGEARRLDLRLAGGRAEEVLALVRQKAAAYGAGLPDKGYVDRLLSDLRRAPEEMSWLKKCVSVFSAGLGYLLILIANGAIPIGVWPMLEGLPYLGMGISGTILYAIELDRWTVATGYIEG